MTHDEMRTKFGDELMKRIQIKAHDAWNESELEHLGQTSRGTPVWINRLVANASLRVTVGMITAHFVAGYGSGFKTIMPGASGYKTIFHNHEVVSVSPQSKMMRSGKIEDVADALGILKFLESNRSTLTLVCDTSFDDDLSNLGFNHAKSVQVAVEEAMMRHGTDAKAIIVPYGAVTHPVLD